MFLLSNAQLWGGAFALALLAFSLFLYFSVGKKGAENIPPSTQVFESTFTVVGLSDGVVSGYDARRSLYVTCKAIEGYNFTNGAIYSYTYLLNQVNDVKII